MPTTTCDDSTLKMRLSHKQRIHLGRTLHATAAARLPLYSCVHGGQHGSASAAAETSSNLAAERCDDPYGCLCVREGECKIGMSIATEYLPDAEYMDALRSRPLPAPTPSAQQLLGQLLDQQFPSSCTARLAPAGYWNAGLGATFHYVLLNTKRALRDNKTVAFVVSGSPAGLDSAGKWNYGARVRQVL